MSRSKRKLPITGITTASSDKRGKQFANRAYRRAVHIALQQGWEVLPQLREVSDVYSFGKDGKKWWRDYVLEKYPELMRK